MYGKKKIFVSSLLNRGCIQSWSLCSNFKQHPHSSSLNLLLLSSSLPIAPLNSRFSQACCLTWQERERGERSGGWTESKKKREGEKGKRKGPIVQFNYQPWLVSALVGNYTTQLQETAPLHPIRVGTEGYIAACFLLLSYNSSLLSWLPFSFSLHLLKFASFPFLSLNTPISISYLCLTGMWST